LTSATFPETGVKISETAYRLNRTKRIIGCEFVSGLRQFDIDNIAELRLSMIRDADDGSLTLHTDPLVVLAVVKIVRNVCH
jgi:hypothetical protein